MHSSSKEGDQEALAERPPAQQREPAQATPEPSTVVAHPEPQSADLFSKESLETERRFANVRAADAECFLKELANLADSGASVERFLAHFKKILPNWARAVGRSVTIKNRAAEGFDVNAPVPHALYTFRETLRRIWREPDARTREFCIQRLWHRELIARDGRLLEPWATGIQVPAPTPFEQCLLFLARWADRTRYCGNLDCPAPYFFAHRRVQKYCSEKCAGGAEKELKRRWWKEHGEQWRAERQKKIRPKKTGRGEKRLRRSTKR